MILLPKKVETGNFRNKRSKNKFLNAMVIYEAHLCMVIVISCNGGPRNYHSL